MKNKFTQVKYFILIVLFSIEAHAMQRAFQMSTYKPAQKQLSQNLSTSTKKYTRTFYQPDTAIFKPHCKRLILVLDPEEDENEKTGSLSYIFCNALRNKSAPLLITKDLITKICNQSHFEHLALTSTDWFCYGHKTTGLLLFIPKEYLIKQAFEDQGKRFKSYTESVKDAPAMYSFYDEETLLEYIKYFGFDISNLDTVDNSSPHTLSLYINTHKTTYSNIPQAIESMLIHKTIEDKYNTLPPENIPSPPWNIYLAGHGMTIEYPTLSSKKESHLENIHYIETRITAAEKILQETSDEKKITKMKREILNCQEYIKQYQQEISKIEEDLKKDIKISILHNKKGLIAGLPTNDFFELMSIFTHKIKTFFLYYFSCYSTGFNQIITNDILSKLNVNFIVSAQGMTEVETSTVRVYFADMFEMLDSFYYDTASFISTKSPRAKLLKDPLQKIISTISDFSANFTRGASQPFIRMPNIGTFKAIAVDKEVKILTNSMALAHQLDGSEIDYTNPDIIAIIVYPPYIATPLKINNHASIVSPTPESLAKRDTDIHIFEKISYNNSLFNVLLELPKFNQHYHNSVFVIKELHCFDEEFSDFDNGKNAPIVIKNMIIRTQYKNNYKSSLEAIFTYNNTEYLFSNVIHMQAHYEFAISTSKPYFVKDKKKLQLYALNTQAKTSFVKQLLGENSTIDTDTTNFMSTLIEKLQEKINIPAGIEKTGILKTVLLEKKLRALEIAILPETINHQKKILTQKNKPIFLLIKSLEKFKNEAEQLQQYEQHPDIQNRLNILLQKIKSEIELFFN